jgi:hypothetical protein
MATNANNLKHLLPPAPTRAPDAITSEEQRMPTPAQAELRARLRKAAWATVKYEDLRKLMGRLMDEALMGDKKAMAMVFELMQGVGPAGDDPATQEKPIMSPAELEKAFKELGYVRKQS